MFDKWRKYSYAAQKQQRHVALRALAWVLCVYLAYALFSAFALRTVVVETGSMQPRLERGDRLLVSSFGFVRPFGKTGSLPLKRGSVVLVEGGESTGFAASAADSFVRFFTAQRCGVVDRRPSVRRVVALPGDEVSMQDFVLRVRPAGEPYALTEFELAARPYDIKVGALPEGWPVGAPLSGSMPPSVVGEGEYYLMADDRSATNDSRTLGPAPASSIRGAALFRYWPFTAMGRP